MKRIKAHLGSLSRPIRVLLLLITLIIAGFWTYLFLDSPPLTAEMGFRRAEKANMIGPAQILAEFQLDQENAKVIVAECDEFDIVYRHSSDSFDVYSKRELPSLYCLSNTRPDTGVNGIRDGVPLQLILFDRNPEAKSATINLQTYEYGYLSMQASAVREYDGFFRFSITPNRSDHASVLREIQNLCWKHYDLDRDLYPVAVSLYDKDGQLLSNQTILPGNS